MSLLTCFRVRQLDSTSKATIGSGDTTPGIGVCRRRPHPHDIEASARHRILGARLEAHRPAAGNEKCYQRDVER